MVKPAQVLTKTFYGNKKHRIEDWSNILKYFPHFEYESQNYKLKMNGLLYNSRSSRLQNCKFLVLRVGHCTYVTRSEDLAQIHKIASANLYREFELNGSKAAIFRVIVNLD